MVRVLQLQGLKNIKNIVPRLTDQIIQLDTSNLQLTECFDYACEHYVITGTFPQNIPDEIKEAIASIPRLKKGPHKELSVIDAIVSERYSYEIEEKLFKGISKIRAKLKKKESHSTEKFEYKPQVGAGESEPIDPESIETKVNPFYGGYYRGYVCRFEPAQHKIVQEEGHAELFEPTEEIESDNLKKCTYETVYDPAKDNLVELPYKAIPLTDSITPSNIGIYRTENGSFYLKPKSSVQTETESKIKQKVSFQFIIAKTKDNALIDSPENEIEIWGDLDAEAEEFLRNIESQPLSEIEKSKQCSSYIRKKFKYPKDENARADMNTKYLSAGNGCLETMCANKVADCYWSNIFCGQLLARLGVNHRVIAGHYVKKDPRFEFAAVAGIGHAWSEIWDGYSWQRIDATPPKEKDEKEEPEEENVAQDGDFGDESPPTDPQEELTIEEIRALFEELINEESGTEKEPSPEDLFAKTAGVNFQKWKTVERYVESINKTAISEDSSISGNPSTIAEEWEKLFELIYKKREVPVESFRGPVRQSEGDELEDPVDAVIDILSGESDPMGYKLIHRKSKEQVDVTSFEDDSILDLTASMSGTPAAEQKKMILSGLYNLMMLGRRLDLDRYKRRMRESIGLRSRVLIFKGNTEVNQSLSTEDILDEKALCRLYDELDKTREGTGNLVGALMAYEAGITTEQTERIKNKKLVKVLTVVSDGGVLDKAQATQIIQRLRQKGIIVQGIGFGYQAQDIRVICHDPKDPEAGKVINDVTKAVGVRHGILSRALKNI
ncbi:MAG: transglutaminase domain-containing protein [Candidatus Gracilibacteria bacterium]|nr:transglutaminase domain-containing protein [Candidatus Gracilibacteria bacterium]